MFLTFTSTPDGTEPPKAKRHKVNRACHYCRKHRVRCDKVRPCMRCVSSNSECTTSTPPADYQDDASSGAADTAPTPAPEFPEASPTTTGDTSTTAEEPDVNIGIDSTAGFTSKICAFSTVISQLALGEDIDADPPPSYTSPYPRFPVPLDSTGISKNPTILPRSQILQVMDIYWARCQHLAPILDRKHIDALLGTLWAADGTELSTSPLIDGAVALCLRRLDASGLTRRLVGLQRASSDSLPPGCGHFQRCLATTSQFSALVEPSLESVQSYILQTLYLLDEGQHQAAYNTIGLALRLAHALNIHRQPESGQDTAVTQRMWWTIVQLDFRCARQLGRPVGIQLAETNRSLPDDAEFSYHSKAVALTKATLAATEAISQHQRSSKRDGTASLESRASAVWEQVKKLHDWRDTHLKPHIGRPLHVDSAGEASWIGNETVGTSPCCLLRSILLELRYYDEIIGIHRSFMCFPSRSLVPQRNPHSDKHATTALKYAIATIDLTHRIMSKMDILYGISEVYEWQWNALLTLIGFLMGYPFCSLSPNARRHVEFALEIFNAADQTNTMAVRASTLGRSLYAKVNSLLEFLKAGARSSALDQGTGSKDSVDGQEFVRDLPCDGDALWSWMDGTDPETWPGYSDEISEMLNEFPQLPFGEDNLFSTI